ncbi:MAG TPA: biotin--[acetyl-CoA-carboxylase] ligase [Pyrinomonadaceae bacterium]|nr:biotin--[acetyl-CoA-carboxylase] ligase [Pyrinomonadaceae bacterium]
MSFTPIVMRFESLPSTNTEAARQAALGAPEGLCVVAREQTAGRGRQGRSWASPKGAGLYVSVVLRPRMDAKDWPLITLAAALAVREAVKEVCALDADIKWPNDLLAGGRKLCGILAETVETPGGRAVVLGVGVNLDDRAFPSELNETATSVAGEAGQPCDADELLGALTRSLARWHETLQREGGPARVVAEWESHSSFARGRRVRVSLPGETFEGVTRGLEPDGALRVETDGRSLRRVRAGDVLALRPGAGKGAGARQERQRR